MINTIPQIVSKIIGRKLRIIVILLTDRLVYINAIKKRRNVTFSNAYIHGVSEKIVRKIICFYRQIS